MCCTSAEQGEAALKLASIWTGGMSFSDQVRARAYSVQRIARIRLGCAVPNDSRAVRRAGGRVGADPSIARDLGCYDTAKDRRMVDETLPLVVTGGMSSRPWGVGRPTLPPARRRSGDGGGRRAPGAEPG